MNNNNNMNSNKKRAYNPHFSSSSPAMLELVARQSPLLEQFALLSQAPSSSLPPSSIPFQQQQQFRVDEGFGNTEGSNSGSSSPIAPSSPVLSRITLVKSSSGTNNSFNNNVRTNSQFPQLLQHSQHPLHHVKVQAKQEFLPPPRTMVHSTSLPNSSARGLCYRDNNNNNNNNNVPLSSSPSPSPSAFLTPPPPSSSPSPKADRQTFLSTPPDPHGSKSVNFVLTTQPEEQQRKAYNSENRYILPNPLVVSQIRPNGNPNSHLPILKDCEASVRLVFLNCEELPINKKDILDGTQRMKMTGAEGQRKAEFALKIRDTSGRSRFRLCFTVTYTCDGQRGQEVLYSEPFRVISNKKNSSKVKTVAPLLVDLNPRQGPFLEDTQVWIRGCHFQDKATTTVFFGPYKAKLVDVEDGLIVCIAPTRSDLQEEAGVVVSVINHTQQGGFLEAYKKLTFHYVHGMENAGAPSRHTSASSGPVPPCSYEAVQGLDPYIQQSPLQLSSEEFRSPPLQSNHVLSEPQYDYSRTPTPTPLSPLPSMSLEHDMVFDSQMFREDDCGNANSIADTICSAQGGNENGGQTAPWNSRENSAGFYQSQQYDNNIILEDGWNPSSPSIFFRSLAPHQPGPTPEDVIAYEQNRTYHNGFNNSVATGNLHFNQNSYQDVHSNFDLRNSEFGQFEFGRTRFYSC